MGWSRIWYGLVVLTLGLGAMPALAQTGSALGTILGGLNKQPPSPPPIAVVAVEPQSLKSANSTFPLREGERLLSFQNGCAQLIPDVEGNQALVSMGRQTLWLGTCRFGLADGPGFTLYQGQGSEGKYYPTTMRLGRLAAASAGANSSVVVIASSGPRQDNQESIVIEPEISPTGEAKGLFAPGGRDAPVILAQSQRSDTTRQITDTLWLRKISCPISYTKSMDQALVELGTTSLNAQQRKIVGAMCQGAIKRLKGEGSVPEGSFGAPSFAKVDYGYFFAAYVERSESPHFPPGVADPQGQYDLMTGFRGKTFPKVALCPTITSLAGCEPVWRGMLAPFITKRDELLSVRNRALTEDEADRVRRAAPLEADLHQQVAAIAARYASQARPSSPAVPTSYPVARPRLRKGVPK